MHLGVLTRADNKGTDVVVELAERGVAGWQLAFAGVGAPSPAGAISHNRFLAAGELVAVVEASTSTLLPYRFASQSGVIVLAQALGSVPIATRVGGLPEQIEDGVTGLLLPQGAGADELAEALRRLDGPEATAMAAKGQATAWDRHADFARAVRGLL
ncbi:MAG: glycosyltransferase [Acidimicrobiales bacterium]|nr:glycosyltransferase [Acidimicrobiales bacterium]